MQVALIFGICEALRKAELCNVKVRDLEDLKSVSLVRIPHTKNKTPRSFTITGKFYEIYKKYANLRAMVPNVDQIDCFFLNFQAAKCTRQVVGVNKFGSVPKVVAKFLNLPDADHYTGHTLRRSSATILVDSGADLLTLKRHGGWKSNTVAEGYTTTLLTRNWKHPNKLLDPSQNLHYRRDSVSRKCNPSSTQQELRPTTPSTVSYWQLWTATRYNTWQIL